MGGPKITSYVRVGAKAENLRPSTRLPLHHETRTLEQTSRHVRFVPIPDGDGGEDWYYFARRKETSDLLPAEETGLIKVSTSSVSTVMGRV